MLTVKSNLILQTSALQGHTVYWRDPTPKAVDEAWTMYDWFKLVDPPSERIFMQQTPNPIIGRIKYDFKF